MRHGKWRALGPLALGFVALLLGGGVIAAVGSRETRRVQTAGIPGCSGHAATKGRAWYQLDERTDARGTLTGYTLRYGLLDGRGQGSIGLPPESFAANPSGAALLYGLDDGATSEAHLLAVAAGCDRVVARSRDVIRRATLDPTGTQLYYHLRDRRTRADLGVWRQSLGDGQTVERVLPPLAEGARGRRTFGPSFSTEFAWSAEGSTLAVQSCAAFECRTRVVEVATRTTTAYDAPGQGELLGLTRDQLLVYAACAGLPCPVQAIDRRSGRARVVVHAAGTAIVVNDRDEPLLVYEPATARHGYQIVALEVGSGRARVPYRASPPGLRLLPRFPRALAAAAAPEGWVLLTGGGRLTASGRWNPELLRLADGARVEFRGATR